MGRPRIYNTPGEKKAAYRARHPEKRKPLNSTLAAQATTLHGLICDAADSGNRTARKLAGENAEDTMSRLIQHFKSLGVVE